MYTCVHGIALYGLQGILVGVEADVQRGLPAFDIVGLPASSIREARERVRSALVNSGYTWPRSRIVISLVPADWRKDGTGLDLPIAIAILVASEQIPPVDANSVLLGELALDGVVRDFRGAWAALRRACETGAKAVIIPEDVETDGADSSLPTRIYRIPNLCAAISALAGRRSPSESPRNVADAPPAPPVTIDLSDVIGQNAGKRALEIAAAGSHHILLAGPPGGGKTMLAARLPTILPPPTPDEQVEIKHIYSIAGLSAPHPQIRPFRTPHHTITPQGLLGGGMHPRPGEVSLAHCGVLFLDEFPEFSRASLEGLRQPLESGSISVSRAQYSCSFPSRFQLIAAMNPCPCGYHGTSGRSCTCDARSVGRYRAKLSGPILDRIDLSVWLDEFAPISFVKEDQSQRETSADVLQRVRAAREARALREKDLYSFTGDSQLTPSGWVKQNLVEEAAVQLLYHSAKQMHFSARSLHKGIRVARTIADLCASDFVREEHMAEALQYRMFA